MEARDPRVQRVAQALVHLYDALSPTERPPTPTNYTSSKHGPRPPGKTARWCRENFRHVPGARKEGRDWVVSASAYEKHFAARTPEQPPPAERDAIASAHGWSPRTALERATLRSTSDGDS